MKKLTVDGITFETTKEAKAAERELEAIEKIRGRMDVTDPTYAKVLYEKLIEKEMLHTKVGDKFLAELQGYFAPEAAEKTADTGAVEPDGEQPEETVPYLEGIAQAGAASAEGEETPSEESAAENAESNEVTGAEDAAQEPEEETDSAQTAEQSAKETTAEEILFGTDFDAMPQETTEEPVEAELDSFMQEYGLNDEGGAGQPEEEAGEFSEEELEAFMGEDAAQTVEPESGKTEEELAEEENGEISAEDLEALAEEYSEAGSPDVLPEEEPSFDLKIGEKEEEAGQEEEFHLNLDEATLYDDEPDNDTLLAEAQALKKELHQEDLSEVFSERGEQPEKKRFSLYGVLLVSLLLNVILIASMAVMVQVFRNSDNRNILNYERILEQEYQTATLSDADAGDIQ